MKTAIFRFEASPKMGAGHAVRSYVIAEFLSEKGWNCKIITSSLTYEFIKTLGKFERIDPLSFFHNPIPCQLFIIDHYELGEDYERHFRSCVEKIFVIDDLANRNHDCDILLDQSYQRKSQDYLRLVPQNCQIFTGSEYTLLRKEFPKFRQKAIEKRRRTQTVDRILISMGGGDAENCTLKILQMIKNSSFKGALDVVLGFSSSNFFEVKSFLSNMNNHFNIHIDTDMVKLIYQADLAIGSSGSSVWERCCLGLPQILMMTAKNQSFIFSKVSDFSLTSSLEDSNLIKSIKTIESRYQFFVDKVLSVTSGLGIEKIFTYLESVIK